MTNKKNSQLKPISVRRYRSPNIPISAIWRYVRQIVERFDPDRVILFGSYAWE
jgi:hypothetical protein